MKIPLQEIDRLVAEAKFDEAVEKYFSDDAMSFSSRTNNAYGKYGKLHNLRTQMRNIDKVNEIRLIGSSQMGNVTFSEFNFDFTVKGGQHLHWREIIRRTWGTDGKVVEELYFPAERLDKPQARVIDRKVDREILVERQVPVVTERYKDKSVPVEMKLTREVADVKEVVVEKKVPSSSPRSSKNQSMSKWLQRWRKRG